MHFRRFRDSAKGSMGFIDFNTKYGSIHSTVLYPLFCTFKNRKMYKITGTLQNKGYVYFVQNKRYISMHSGFETSKDRHSMKMILNEKLMIEDES